MNAAPMNALPGKMIQLARILVATDFSRESNRALDYAISLARRYGSHVYLAHVISPDAYLLAAPEVTVDLVDSQRRDAENKFQELLLSGRLGDVPHDLSIEEGALWPSLQKIIGKREIDLVLVGTHGVGMVVKFILGSGAEQIFRQAACPVLTVGPAVEGGAPPEVVFNQILFATDFGHGSERQAAYAFSLAQEHDATVTLLHVVRHLQDYSKVDFSLKKETIKRQLLELVPNGAEVWCNAQFRVAIGDPASEILCFAEENKTDLIVMGAKARAGFAGHVPVSTAYKVVSKSHCPVLTVRS